MFKLKTDHTYSWPVTVHEPTDGGTFVKRTFDATFKVIPQERINEILGGDNIDNELLREVTTGWKGVQDEDGADIAFTEATLRQLLSVPYARAGMVEAYLNSLAGGAKRKN